MDTIQLAFKKAENIRIEMFRKTVTERVNVTYNGNDESFDKHHTVFVSRIQKTIGNRRGTIHVYHVLADVILSGGETPVVESLRDDCLHEIENMNSTKSEHTETGHELGSCFAILEIGDFRHPLHRHFTGSLITRPAVGAFWNGSVDVTYPPLVTEACTLEDILKKLFFALTVHNPGFEVDTGLQ